MASESHTIPPISGRGGVRLRTADGRQLRLHSAIDPVGEAERWVRESGEGLPGAFLVIGFGEGYLLDALSRLRSSALVIALEPDPAVAAAWRHSERGAAWTASAAKTSQKLHLLTGPEYAGAGDAWRDLPEDARVLIHPVYARECADEVERAKRVAARIMFDAEGNREARRRLEGIYRNHTWHNVPSILASGDVRALFGRFPGCPALLVGAGPSLDAVLPALPSLRDRALIVAADTTLRPLLAAGVEPHLVISADPSELNGRHLRDLPGLKETWLVAEPSVHPAAFRSFAGRTFTFRIAAHDPWPRLHAHGLDRGFLHIWGSVLTAGFDLALRLGCGPIAFVGADLAFTGGRPYCRNTVYEESWTHLAAGRPLPDIFRAAVDRWPDLEMPDVHDRPTRTAPHLVAFRDWMVAHAARHADRAVFNATGSGILHGAGIVQTSLEALRREWAPVTNIVTTLEACAAAAVPPPRDATQLRAEAVGEAKELEEGATVASWTGLAPWALPERVAVVNAIVRGERIPDWLKASTPRQAPSDEEFGRTVAELVSLAECVTAAYQSATGHESLPAAFRPALTGYWGEAADVALRLERWTVEAAAAARDDVAGLLSMSVQGPAPIPVPLPAQGQEIGGELDPIVLALLRAAWLRARVSPAIASLRLLGLLRMVSRAIGAPVTPQDDVLLTVEAFVGRATAASARVSARVTSLEWLSSLTGAIVREPSAPPRAERALEHYRLTADDPTAENSRGVTLRVTAKYPDDRPSRLIHPPIAWVTPLAHSGDPKLRVARLAQLSDTEAIVTPWGGDRSYALDEAGVLRELAAWPDVISGEVRRCDGGHLAWSNGPSARLFFRDADDAPVHAIDMPFQTSRWLPLADGAALATAVGGGLWRWDRRDGVTRIADVPSGVIVRAGTDTAWSEEVPRTHDGRALRTFDGTRSEVTLSTGHVSNLPVAAEGACWGAADRDGWEVRIYPHADAVVLDCPEAGRLSVSCGYPNGLAWAGRSLVVCTAFARLYVFPNLLEVLLACGRA